VKKRTSKLASFLLSGMYNSHRHVRWRVRLHATAS